MNVEQDHILEADLLTAQCFGCAMTYIAKHVPGIEADRAAWADMVSSYAGIMSATLSHIVMPEPDEDKESWEG